MNALDRPDAQGSVVLRREHCVRRPCSDTAGQERLFPGEIKQSRTSASGEPLCETPTESGRCSCGIALKGRLGQAYNEEAFQYFLAIERKRSERLGRPLLLLLVDLTERSGVSGRIDPRIARKLFSGLCLCLRETDVIGWYREARVAGAVLAEPRDETRMEVSRLVVQRVRQVLSERLPVNVVRRLQMHVCHYPEPEGIDSGRPRDPGAELISGEL